MNIKRIIGIDPGTKKNTGMSYIEYDKASWELKSVGEFDLELLHSLVFRGELRTLAIAVEKAQASPSMGVVSAFNYGLSFGRIVAPVDELVKKHNLVGSFVNPVTWKMQFNLLKKPKSASVAKVKSIFKHSDPTLLKGLTSHHADSILIGLSLTK
jgi:hypothetical protein